jgi:hypothetical protein
MAALLQAIPSSRNAAASVHLHVCFDAAVHQQHVYLLLLPLLPRLRHDA